VTVIDVRGDILYLEVPGQLRFMCPFRKVVGLEKVARNDTIDIIFERQEDRLLARVYRVVSVSQELSGYRGGPAGPV
jgi:hypothetical protein